MSADDGLVRLPVGGGIWARPAYHEQGYPEALDEIWVRTGLTAPLRDAARALAPAGVGLLVLDGWRPAALQGALYSAYRAAVAASTGLDGADLDRRVAEFVTRPDRVDPPPAHSTGGAVDVTLCDVHGAPLDMGGAFDELTDRSHPGHYEREPLTAAERTFRDRRRLLAGAMARAGFSPFPTEWWHYELGTRLWAEQRGGAPRYSSPATPPR